MRRINFINGISGVAPGGVATLNMPLERRYHGVKLFASVTDDGSGSASTDPVDIIDYIKLIVNGVVIRDLTPLQIRKIAQANFGGTAATDHVQLFFSDPTRATVIGEESTAWDMFGQNTFVIEMKLKAGTTNPSVTTQASFDFNRNEDPGTGKPFLNIVKQHGLTYNAPAGDFDIVNLPIALPIQRIHIEPGTGTVSQCEVSSDGETVFEATKAQNDALHLDYGIDSPFGFSVIFDYEQQVTSPLKVLRQMNLKPTFSASNNTVIVLERLAQGYA